MTGREPRAIIGWSDADVASKHPPQRTRVAEVRARRDILER
jgi:hypothetical protein